MSCLANKRSQLQKNHRPKYLNSHLTSSNSKNWSSHLSRRQLIWLLKWRGPTLMRKNSRKVREVEAHSSTSWLKQKKKKVAKGNKPKKTFCVSSLIHLQAKTAREVLKSFQESSSSPLPIQIQQRRNRGPRRTSPTKIRNCQLRSRLHQPLKQPNEFLKRRQWPNSAKSSISFRPIRHSKEVKAWVESSSSPCLSILLCSPKTRADVASCSNSLLLLMTSKCSELYSTIQLVALWISCMTPSATIWLRKSSKNVQMNNLNKLSTQLRAKP